MPPLSGTALSDRIVTAIQEAGVSAVRMPGTGRHPLVFVVEPAVGGPRTLWAYTWTLTFGGRRILPDEYRIQMTGVQPPLALNPSGWTALLGYEPDLDLFAGFDIVHHRQFTHGSPSVQIDIRTVRQALHDGLTFAHKSNREIAVGIRPAQLLAYIRNADALHRVGADARTFALLVRASALEPLLPSDLEVVDEERRRIILTVSRLARAGTFRQSVFNAYGNHCAVTRAQLRLLDAAHILPVGVPGSTDEVRNGLALSPTYHRAFDASLIYLDERLVMHVNSRRVGELRALNLAGGLEIFGRPLGRILLPHERAQWPHIPFIRRANVTRGISI